MEDLKHTKGTWKVSYSSAHSSHQTFDVDMRNPKFEEKAANIKLIESSSDLLKALIEANNELKSIISILDGRITPEIAKTDLGMRLVSFFKSNAFICEEKFEPVINKATK